MEGETMATIYQTTTDARRGEERFFFKMAASMAAVIILGFSLNLGLGRSSFAVPLVYHLHAVVYFSWIALLVTQSALVSRGNLALHRRLGWLSVVLLPVMFVLGIAITIASLQRTGGPFFFDANEFLISNPLGLLAFVSLAGAAIVMRRRTDWHRRLMLGAMATILGPGFGRILPTPLMGAWAWEITNLVGLSFVAVGMLRDRRHLGYIHPAWFFALAAGLGWIVLGQLLAYTDWGIAVTEQVMAGHPGAARPMQAYVP
jgi:uncharacterized membrane protein YozB (DUF420 family)